MHPQLVHEGLPPASTKALEESGVERDLRTQSAPVAGEAPWCSSTEN